MSFDECSTRIDVYNLFSIYGIFNKILLTNSGGWGGGWGWWGVCVGDWGWGTGIPPNLGGWGVGGGGGVGWGGGVGVGGVGWGVGG